MKLGFIGLGNMAEAMIGGITAKRLVSAADIIGSDLGEEKKNQMREKFQITVADDNRTVVEQADIVVLAVKPQMYEGVIHEIRDCVNTSQLIISIAPGKTLEWLKGQFGKELKLIRCMPNTPALVGEGCTGVCRNASVTEEEFMTVSALLNGVGKAYAVEEKQMDAVVAVSGSSGKGTNHAGTMYSGKAAAICRRNSPTSTASVAT